MDLSREDALRLNVLLAGTLHAIRIDESALTVHGLSERGEAHIKLNPCGRTDQYLRLVRETISGQVLGSPGGYPVYLKRWTRMGQARDESLAQLLKLGEPEAVSAVVHAPGLTEARSIQVRTPRGAATNSAALQYPHLMLRSPSWIRREAPQAEHVRP